MNPPVDILTGFLGSGKTTLLRKALERDYEGRRIAVVMNEIGAIGLDGKVVTGLDFVEEMVEISGGCVCCSIPNYRFAAAMQELVQRVRPHLIVIETTGIADPWDLVRRLHELGYPVDGVTTVVDAANYLEVIEKEPVGRAQVAAADFLVINKCDLVNDRSLERLEKRLRRANRRAVFSRAVGGEVDYRLIFGLGGQYWRKVAEEGGAVFKAHHRDHDHLGIEAFTWSADSPLDRRCFEKAMKKLPAEIYRAKGLLRFDDEEVVHSFNYVAGRLDVARQPIPGFAGVQSVFIGRDAVRRREAVVRRLERCLREAEG